MTITSKAVAKVAAVATGLAMATSMLSLAPMAHAACSVGTANLTVGSSGAAVTCLQQTLIGAGYSIPAGATGYFGMQTKSAVAAWQAAAGVSPAAGFFGPISRAALGGVVSTGGGSSMVPGCAAGAMFSSTTGQACFTSTSVPGCAPGAMFSSTTGAACGTTSTGSTGPLSGTDGTIDDYQTVGSFNNEQVGEGQNDVKIYGADVDASKDGDIALKSIKVKFDATGNTGSTNLNRYIDGVNVWLGSTKVGSADVSDFNKDSTGVYTKTITLNNAVIRADQTGTLYISVDAVNSMDSADISGDSWTVEVDSVRFVDGSGVTTTDSETGDIGSDGTVGIDFTNFGTAANTELKISLDSSSPNAGVVIVDDVSNTDNVSLLKGRLKLDGTSDVNIDQFPVTFTTVGGASLSAVTGSVKLKLDGKTYSESVSSGALVASIVFDNLDFDMSAGDTVNFEVLADINDIDAGNFDEGDTLKASVTATNRDYIDVENAQGDQLSDSSEKSGTATGEAQEFRTSGISVALVGTPTAVSDDPNTGGQTGTFKLTYKVTAVGDTVYIASLASAAVTYAVDRSGTATTSNSISAALVDLTDNDKTSVGNYQIDEGSSETFELTVVVPNGAGGTTGLFRTTLTGVKWDTSDDITPSNTYTSNLDALQTPYVNLRNGS